MITLKKRETYITQYPSTNTYLELEIIKSKIIRIWSFTEDKQKNRILDIEYKTEREFSIEYLSQELQELIDTNIINISSLQFSKKEIPVSNLLS